MSGNMTGDVKNTEALTGTVAIPNAYNATRETSTGHSHNVYDTDKHFTIDPHTRELVNMTPDKKSVMQFDHNSERITFALPRMVDGHDTMACNVVEIHYINTDANTKVSNPGLYEVDDMAVSIDDENIVTCSWLVSRNATQLVGPLKFRLTLRCVSVDDVGYSWSTAICKELNVSEGIDNSGWVAEEYADILAQYQARIKALEDGGSTKLREVVLLAENWQDGEAGQYYQVVDIEGVTKKSMVSLELDAKQIIVMQDKVITFHAENEGGTVTIFATGDRPTLDYVLQASITEVQ